MVGESETGEGERILGEVFLGTAGLGFLIRRISRRTLKGKEREGEGKA